MREGTMRRLVIALALATLSSLALVASPATAALLRGETDQVEGVDEFGGFVLVPVLSRITYRETATAQRNEVSYLSQFVAGQQVICSPFGPGPSQCLETGAAEEHVFFDRTATINRGRGRCVVTGMAVGLCEGPSANSASVAPTVNRALPVEIELGRRDDTLQAFADDTLLDPAIVAMTVTAGPGNDTIDLVDHTAEGQAGLPDSGTDRIACGAGFDEVTTTAATDVASDCERVTRIG